MQYHPSLNGAKLLLKEAREAWEKLDLEKLSLKFQ